MNSGVSDTCLLERPTSDIIVLLLLLLLLLLYSITREARKKVFTDIISPSPPHAQVLSSQKVVETGIVPLLEVEKSGELFF